MISACFSRATKIARSARFRVVSQMRSVFPGVFYRQLNRARLAMPNDETRNCVVRFLSLYHETANQIAVNPNFNR